MPKRISNLHRAWISAYDRIPRSHRRGRWNAALDIWFSKRKSNDGQATGAELMIWMKVSGFGHPSGPFPVTIDGLRFRVIEWTTTGGGSTHRWPLIIFRRINNSQSFVHRIPMMPFIKFAERHRWIKKSYWLEGVHSGFELWRHGQGLGVEWLHVHL